MIQLGSKVSRIIWLFIYGLLAVSLAIVIFLSLMKPQHHLFGWQMLIGTCLGSVLFLFSFYIWNKFLSKWAEGDKWLFPILLILFGCLLYIVSCYCRNLPESLTDYGRVWKAALELAEGKSLSEEWYFKIYSNNIKPMLYLSALMKIAYCLGFHDPFYFILILSVLEVMGAVWGCVFLVGNTAEERRRYRIPILLMFVALLPIWANVQAFYTDSMSFAIGIVALALIKISFNSKSRIRVGGLLLLSGILVGIGMIEKVTIAIPLIAGFLVVLYFFRSRKNLLYLCISFIFAMGVVVLTSLWAENYEIWRVAQNTGEPVIDWIALGMKGNGSWYDNQDYIGYVSELPTKAEKVAYTKQYIWENRRDFFDITHLIEKVRYNFASGNLGAHTYSYSYLNMPNAIWEMFSPWGAYFWRTSQICFCYICSVYVIYLLGAIDTFISIIKKRKLSAIKIVTDLAFLGNIIFLMIWEANNRQLYNQMPVMILGAVMSVRQIETGILALHHRKNRKRGEVYGDNSEK